MTREIGCPTCGRTIMVADDAAAMVGRCPECERQSVRSADAQTANGATFAPGSGAVQGNSQHAEWYLLTPEGPIYGPISWPEVEQWTAEGRLDAACQLGNSAAGPWRAAGELLPSLAVAKVPQTIVSAAPLPSYGSSAEPFTAANPQTSHFAPQPGAWIAPHRGTVVFILGLLGLVVGCPVFSFAAWAMATRDLAEMRSGRMDRSGEGLTLGGLILGLIVSLMWFVCLFGMLLVLLVYVARRL